MGLLRWICKVIQETFTAVGIVMFILIIYFLATDGLVAFSPVVLFGACVIGASVEVLLSAVIWYCDEHDQDEDDIYYLCKNGRYIQITISDETTGGNEHGEEHGKGPGDPG